MSQNQQLEEALARHPCYNRDAHLEFARMHVPVAPRCNIQCNYCNRKYDCCNESRPGVTSEVLSPEQAAEKVAYVKSRIPNLSVIGIAGPGDPLANDETFRTLELVASTSPDLTLCVSTNGLALPDCAQRLYDLGVRFITVTMNACDPGIGARVYGSVVWEGRVLKGVEGASKLIERQTQGIRACSDLGMLVKVNIVMIPGINDAHIPELVKYVKSNGAYIVNILPLIPVEGTPFADMRAPTPEERRELMDRCSLDARMMRHCRQCRADAIGLLDQDRSQEFAHFGGCGSGCGPQNIQVKPNVTIRDPLMVAVATSDGKTVDSGFGNASRFMIYRKGNAGWTLVHEVRTDTKTPASGKGHRDHIASVAASLGECSRVVVKEIGHMPSEMLVGMGIAVTETDGPVEETLASFDPDGRE